MDREQEIKVLMADYCTENEAKRHLSIGTTVYNVTEEPWDETYAEEVGVTLDEIKRNGHKIGFSYVEIDGIEYVIEYIL